MTFCMTASKIIWYILYALLLLKYEIRTMSAVRQRRRRRQWRRRRRRKSARMSVRLVKRRPSGGQPGGRGKSPGKPMSRVGRAVSALRRRPSRRSRLADGPGGRPMARAKVRPRSKVPPRRESSARRAVAPHSPDRYAAGNGYTSAAGTCAWRADEVADCQEKRSCGKRVVPPPIHLILFLK